MVCGSHHNHVGPQSYDGTIASKLFDIAMPYSEVVLLPPSGRWERAESLDPGVAALSEQIAQRQTQPTNTSRYLAFRR